MGLSSSLPVLTPNYGDMPLSLFGGQVNDFEAAHTAVPKGLKVHVSIFCSGCGEVTGFWTARRQTAFKMRRGTRRWRQYASSGGQGNHLWLSQGLWPSSTPVAGADRTRPVSWLGSISFGAHPRTKGARCFTGGHRGRTPSSPKCLLASRAQGARRPFGPDVESADQQAVLSGRSGKHLQSSRRRESQERDMPLQKAGACLGCPAGSGAMPDNRWKTRLGQDVSGRRQEALGAVRRLREAARLPPDDSIATVPLQSG